MSNNYRPVFTDEELLTVYLFGSLQGRKHIRSIHQYAKDHLLEWFPQLPSYQAFDKRLNNLSPAFELLIHELIASGISKHVFNNISLIDSMPIMVAGKVRGSIATTANEICSLGYCSSKSMYYYGVKLHLLGYQRNRKMPFPECIWITSARVNDLKAARPVFEKIKNRIIIGDKSYSDEKMIQALSLEHKTNILTPIKRTRNQQFKDAAQDMHSQTLSGIRQPIESFFNWINEKTSLQNATKVRSTKGLFVHVFGKFVAALLLLSLLKS